MWVLGWCVQKKKSTNNNEKCKMVGCLVIDFKIKKMLIMLGDVMWG